MKHALNILFLLFFAVSCKPQSTKKINEQNNQGTYKRINDQNSWGFINQDNDTIIPLGKYKFLNPIDDEGMILAELNGKHGYISINQDTLIHFNYDDLSEFTYGLVSAKLNGKYGFLDRKGKVIIPFEYDSPSYFYRCQLAKAELNGKYGFINKDGNVVIPIKYEKVRDNRIDSLVCAMQNGKWAFFNCSGEQLTAFKFDQITESYYDDRNYTYFKKGLCRVQNNNQFGYINNQFEEVVPFGKYSKAEPFCNYLGIIAKNGKFGIIDTLGNEVLPLKYDLIEHPTEYLNESVLFVVKQDKNLQLLDKKAKPITDFNIKEYVWDSYKGKETYQRSFVLTDSSGMVGTVSDNGIKEIPLVYQKIEPFDGRSVTYAKRDGKFGLIDYSGKIIYPFEYDDIVTQKFFDYFIVNNSGKYGMVDNEGKQILSFSYQTITPVFYDKDKRFIVQQNGLFGMIDLNENVIIPIEYDEISNWVEYGPKEHFITKKGKKGLISKDGKIVIPPQYDEIWVDNSELIKVENMGLYGTIDWKNNIVNPIKYQEILWEWPYLTNKELDTIYLKQNGKYFSTDLKGNVIENKVSKEFIEEKFEYLLNTR